MSRRDATFPIQLGSPLTNYEGFSDVGDYVKEFRRSNMFIFNVCLGSVA